MEFVSDRWLLHSRPRSLFVTNIRFFALLSSLAIPSFRRAFRVRRVCALLLQILYSEVRACINLYKKCSPCSTGCRSHARGSHEVLSLGSYQHIVGYVKAIERPVFRSLGGKCAVYRYLLDDLNLYVSRPTSSLIAQCTDSTTIQTSQGLP